MSPIFNGLELEMAEPITDFSCSWPMPHRIG
jgi:hypothetical protein